MRKENLRIPLNLQMFAEDDPAGGGDGSGNGNASGQQAQQNNVTFDYDKLASIISGKQNVAEDTVLKNYFKQQGLSQEEMQTAISSFKQQKAASTPNTDELTQQLAEQTKLANQYQIEQAATLEALGLGLDQKSIPYVIKLADLSNAIVDGKVNTENINKSLSKVLEDVPQFKAATQVQQKGGFQIGTGQGTGGQSDNVDTLAAIFGNK